MPRSAKASSIAADVSGEGGTGLPNGRYRLTATADPGHLVKEISYANNAAWAKIRITDTSVTVLRYGPGA